MRPPSSTLVHPSHLHAVVIVAMLLLPACSSPPRPSTSLPPLAAPSATPTTAPSISQPAEAIAPEQAQAVALHAVGLVGTPYRYGGNSPDAGFDCSGLIGYVYWHAANTRAPRTVAQIVQWGQPVMRQALRTGDLVVFTARGQPNHAGIYVGDGRFVHAPSSGGTVRLEALSARHWMSMDVSYRRP